jgi:hypothetical protein
VVAGFVTEGERLDGERIILKLLAEKLRQDVERLRRSLASQSDASRCGQVHRLAPPPVVT